MWNILNGVPLVGHVKGVVHYATGDFEAGNKAMAESTRSTAVLGAGAVGMIGGPGTAVALGVATGALWDCAESAATDTPTGVVAGVTNIVETASNGDVPVLGILQTSLTLTGDALGGIGGGSLATSISQAAGQSATNTIGKSVGKSAGEQILKSASVPAGEMFGKSVAQSVGKSVGKSVGESVGKSVAKQVTKTVILEEAVSLATYGTARAAVNVAEQEMAKDSKSSTTNTKSQNSQPPPNSQSQSSGTSSNSKSKSNNAGSAPGGNGQQPPRQNSKGSTSQPQRVSHIQAFLNFFGVQSLSLVRIANRNIFQNLPSYQRNELIRIIRALRDHPLGMQSADGILARILETMTNIFEAVDAQDVTFLNFISLAEFIMQYLTEAMQRQSELQGVRRHSQTLYEQRRRENISIANVLLAPHDYTILRVFREIRTQIQQRELVIQFRDIFTAVYHYFKHRRVDRYELSVEQYYRIAKDASEIIVNTQEFRDLVVSGGEIVFHKYSAYYGRWLKVVVKKQGDRVDMSSCYFVEDNDHPSLSQFDADDGNMYINNRKLN